MKKIALVILSLGVSGYLLAAPNATIQYCDNNRNQAVAQAMAQMNLVLPDIVTNEVDSYMRENGIPTHVTNNIVYVITVTNIVTNIVTEIHNVSNTYNNTYITNDIVYPTMYDKLYDELYETNYSYSPTIALEFGVNTNSYQWSIRSDKRFVFNFKLNTKNYQIVIEDNKTNYIYNAYDIDPSGYTNAWSSPIDTGGIYYPSCKIKVNSIKYIVPTILDVYTQPYFDINIEGSNATNGFFVFGNEIESTNIIINSTYVYKDYLSSFFYTNSIPYDLIFGSGDEFPVSIYYGPFFFNSQGIDIDVDFGTGPLWGCDTNTIHMTKGEESDWFHPNIPATIIKSMTFKNQYLKGDMKIYNKYDEVIGNVPTWDSITNWIDRYYQRK